MRKQTVYATVAALAMSSALSPAAQVAQVEASDIGIVEDESTGGDEEGVNQGDTQEDIQEDIQEDTWEDNKNTSNDTGENDNTSVSNDVDLASEDATESEDDSNTYIPDSNTNDDSDNDDEISLLNDGEELSAQKIGDTDENVTEFTFNSEDEYESFLTGDNVENADGVYTYIGDSTVKLIFNCDASESLSGTGKLVVEGNGNNISGNFLDWNSIEIDNAVISGNLGSNEKTDTLELNNCTIIDSSGSSSYATYTASTVNINGGSHESSWLPIVSDSCTLKGVDIKTPVAFTKTSDVTFDACKTENIGGSYFISSISSSSTLSIKNMDIENIMPTSSGITEIATTFDNVNYTNVGSTWYVSDSDVTIKNSTFDNAGLIEMYKYRAACTLTLENSEIKNNKARAAIRLYNGITVNVKDCQFSGNKVYDIDTVMSEINISGSTFTGTGEGTAIKNNSSSNLSTTPAVSIKDSSFENYEYGLYTITSTSLDAENTEFKNCTNGVYIDYNSSYYTALKMNNVNFTGFTTGLFVTRVTPGSALTGCTFTGKDASNSYAVITKGSYGYTNPSVLCNVKLLSNTTNNYLSYFSKESSFAVEECSISNCYSGISTNSGDGGYVWVEQTTFTDVNNGIGCSDRSSGKGLTVMMKDCEITAIENPVDTSAGIYPRDGSTILNTNISGFNYGIKGYSMGQNNSDGSVKSNFTAYNCNIDANIAGAVLYQSNLVNCKITTGKYGVAIFSEGAIIGCDIAGKDNALAGISDSGIDLNNTTSAPSGSSTGTYTSLMNTECLDAKNLITTLEDTFGTVECQTSGKTKVHNFGYGVCATQSVKYEGAEIYDCTVGTYTKYYSYIGANNEWHDCNVAIQSSNIDCTNNVSDNYKYSINNLIYDCKTGIDNSVFDDIDQCKNTSAPMSYKSGDTVSENKIVSNFEIYDCDTGINQNGGLSIMLYNIHDCTTGVNILDTGKSIRSYYTTYEISNCETGIVIPASMSAPFDRNSCQELASEDGSSDFRTPVLSFTNNDTNIKLSGEMSVYARAFSLDDNVTWMDKDSTLDVYTVPDLIAMIFDTEKEGYYDGRVFIKASGSYYPASAVYSTFETAVKSAAIRVKENGWIAKIRALNADGTEVVSDSSDLKSLEVYLAEGIYVTYDYATNGGSAFSGDYDTVAYEKGTNVDLTYTATKNGYTFIGWNTDKDAKEGLSAEEEHIAITDSDWQEDVTLYAIYKKSVDVTYHAYDDSLDFTSSVDFYNNETETTAKLSNYTAAANSNYVFEGYTLDADAAVTSDTTLLSEGGNITASINGTDVYAVYAVTGNLTYKGVDGTTTVDSDSVTNHYVANLVTNKLFSFIVKNKIPAAGYTFDGWTDGNTTYQVGSSYSSAEFNSSLKAVESAIKAISITVTPKSSNVEAGDTVQMSAEVLPADTLDKSVTWASSDDRIATVDENGLVTAVAPGTVTITATTKDGSNLSDSGIVSVDELCVIYDTTTNGGDKLTDNYKTIHSGSDVDLSVTASKDGYEFIGWNTDKDATTGLSALTMGTENIILYAIYGKEVTVTYHMYDENHDVKEMMYNNDTSKVCIYEPASSVGNYAFSGYTTDDSNTENLKSAGSEYTLTLDGLDIYGVYEISGRILYVDESNMSLLDEDKAVLRCVASDINDYKFNYVIKDNDGKEGYIFNGWTYNNKTYNAGESFVTTDTDIMMMAAYTKLEAPTTTETPTITEAPTTTEAPITTEIPAITETPATTAAPAVTETPATTEAPAATEVKTGDESNLIITFLAGITSLFGSVFLFWKKKGKEDE